MNLNLNVSSIQHFSVGDGDGIRTTVFLKGCNLHCPWCHNPETIPAHPVTLHYAKGDEINGRPLSVDEVVAEVLEDADFYGADGGVTVSGGEPMLQAEAVAALLRRLKEQGVPAVIDTAGCVPYAAFETLGDLVHTYYFDLKAPDAAGYRTVGGDFDRVWDNLTRLIADGRRVRVRIPLIPEFNDTPDATDRMIAVLREVGAREVDLLPFHRLGSGKYDALGKAYAYRETPSMARAHAESVAARYRAYFAVRVE